MSAICPVCYGEYATSLEDFNDYIPGNCDCPIDMDDD